MRLYQPEQPAYLRDLISIHFQAMFDSIHVDDEAFIQLCKLRVKNYCALNRLNYSYVEKVLEYKGWWPIVNKAEPGGYRVIGGNA